MPTYEAQSLLDSNQPKTARSQSLRLILDAVANGKTVAPASSAQIKSISVRLILPDTIASSP